MPDPTFHRVAQVSDIPQGKMLCATVDGREILVGHLAEGFFAIDNACSHADARLSEGRMRGHRVHCPLHGAAFDIRDGSALTRPAVRPVASHAVQISGEDVLVALAD